MFYADGARGELAALRRATGLATHHGAELTVLGVVDAVATDNKTLKQRFSHIQANLTRDRALAIDSLIAKISPGGTRKVTIKKKVVTGKDYVAVINQATKGGHDLIVKSVNPQNALKEAIFGSCDMRLMHYSPVPVLVLKPLRRKRWRSVLVAVDLLAETRAESSLNANLLEVAHGLSAGEDSDLLAVHVLEPGLTGKFGKAPDGKALAASLKADAERRLGRLIDAHEHLNVTAHLLKGQADQQIVRFVEQQQVDLVVLGSVGRSGLAGVVVGNTAEKIMHQVNCSLLVMKPADWQSQLN